VLRPDKVAAPSVLHELTPIWPQSQELKELTFDLREDNTKSNQ
jgi:hypothetical protein